jgi:hypothetical protein
MSLYSNYFTPLHWYFHKRSITVYWYIHTTCYRALHGDILRLVLDCTVQNRELVKYTFALISPLPPHHSYLSWPRYAHAAGEDIGLRRLTEQLSSRMSHWNTHIFTTSLPDNLVLALVGSIAKVPGPSFPLNLSSTDRSSLKLSLDKTSSANFTSAKNHPRLFGPWTTTWLLNRSVDKTS